MGRIKTSFIKHIAKDLFEKYPDEFTPGFTRNKKAANGLVDIKSKRMRNIVAGYLTSLKKQQKT